MGYQYRLHEGFFKLDKLTYYINSFGRRTRDGQEILQRARRGAHLTDITACLFVNKVRRERVVETQACTWSPGAMSSTSARDARGSRRESGVGTT